MRNSKILTLNLFLQFLILILISSISLAQVAPVPTANPVAAPLQAQLSTKSPELFPDNKVTFRLMAPNATTVAIAGEWTTGQDRNQLMVKGENGLWSITVGPLKAELYGYMFVIDGVSVLDPGNAKERRDGVRNASILLIPGKESELYAVNNVPHSNLTKVWYNSPIMGMQRRMYVYTPAGYENGTTIKDIIPYIETNFCVNADKESRAIAGLSAGGSNTFHIGFANTDKFAWIGMFSCGIFGGKSATDLTVFDAEKEMPGLMTSSDDFNKCLKLYYISVGEQDSRLVSTQNAVKTFKENNLNLYFTTFPDSHEWEVWRSSLSDFVPRLFQ